MFQDENQKIWKLLNGRYEKVVFERSKIKFWLIFCVHDNKDIFTEVSHERD